MLSYRHAYHAGNFADVHKHSVLTVLLSALLQRDNPFCYLDTHSGIGEYDLRSAEAEKTAEYKHGIAKLWGRDDIPAMLLPYLEAIRQCNQRHQHADLRYYPGSPRLVRSLLRPHDQMILTELNSADYQLLKQCFKGDRQVAVHHLDGYQAIKAFLPPKQKRGMVFIDPSYENAADNDRVLAGVALGLSRWPQGIYAVWYPILGRGDQQVFLQQWRQRGIRKILKAELCIHPDDVPLGLNGSGMLIINPPWQLELALTEISAWLWQVFTAGQQGRFSVDWLVPE